MITRLFLSTLLISLLLSFNANSKIIKVEANPQKGFTDGLPFGDKWVSLELNTIMWKNSQKYINEVTDNVLFESPKNECHKITPKMINRSVEFIKRNLK